MSILILEDRKFPSSLNTHITKVDYLQPIVKAIMQVGDKQNPFDFEYAYETVLSDTDMASVEIDYDIDAIYDKIKKYTHVIVLGSRLNELIFAKSFESLIDSISKVGNITFYSYYSSYYCYRNNKKLDFSKIYVDYTKSSIKAYATKFERVTDLDKLAELVDYARKSKIFSFDYETTSLDYMSSEFQATCLGICVSPGYTYIIPIEHYDFDWGDDFESMLELIRTLFLLKDTTKVAHNIKYDMHVSRRYGIKLNPRIADTMLMSHILNENRRHGLKDLVDSYFPELSGYDDSIDFAGSLEQLEPYLAIDADTTLRLFYIFECQLRGEPKLYRLFRNLTMPACIAFEDIEYQGCMIDRELILSSIDEAEILLEKKRIELNAYDEVVAFINQVNRDKTLESIQELESKIENRINSTKLKHIDLDTVIENDKTIVKLISELNDSVNQDKLLSRIENRINSIKSKYKSVEAKIIDDRYIKSYSDQIRELKVSNLRVYTEVNFNSPKQMADLLYRGFNFDIPEEALGEEKTGRDILKSIDHPFINTLFAYRTISKMLSTYYRGILEKLDSDDRIHASFLLHGTITGRISSRGPNLQNIPGRLRFEDEDALKVLKRVKTFFKASEDSFIIQADYAQAELRMIANISKDPTMIQAYKDGKDLHTITGARIAKQSYEDFLNNPNKKEIRTWAKGANFGLVYLVSDEGYINYIYNSNGERITLQTAQEHRKAVFGTYTTLTNWHKKYEKLAKKYGYVETLFGRRRRLLNVNNVSNIGQVNKDIRDAVNAPIQGSAGELTIFNITLLWHRLPDGARIWSSVHDSILFDIHSSKLLTSLNIIHNSCEYAPVHTYFGIKPEDMPVTMKMDYSISNKSWGNLEEIGDFDTIYKHLNL